MRLELHSFASSWLRGECTRVRRASESARGISAVQCKKPHRVSEPVHGEMRATAHDGPSLSFARFRQRRRKFRQRPFPSPLSLISRLTPFVPQTRLAPRERAFARYAERACASLGTAIEPRRFVTAIESRSHSAVALGPARRSLRPVPYGRGRACRPTPPPSCLLEHLARVSPLLALPVCQHT